MKNSQYTIIGLESGGRRRQAFLDAARGFVMFLVVFQHIRKFPLGLENEDGALSFVYHFFSLNTFFMRSGYLNARIVKGACSTVNGAWSVIWAKVMRLMVPALIFLAIHNLLAIRNVTMRMWSLTGGYWFMYCLFLILIVSVTVSYALRRSSVGMRLGALIAISMILLIVKLFFNPYLFTGFGYYVGAGRVCRYMVFFVMGMTVNVFHDKIFRVLENYYAGALPIALTAILIALRFSVPHIAASYLPLLDFGISLLATFTVFWIFYASSEYWNEDGKIQRFFTTCGRRSIDIYMLHYFLMPALPAALSQYFVHQENMVVEVVFVGSVAFFVTLGALVVSNVLRTSPLLARLLFGARTKPVKTVKPENC